MSVQDLVTAIKNAVAGGDAVRNVVVAGVFILLVGLLVAAIVYAIHLASPRGRLDSLLKESAGRDRRPPWALRMLAVPLLVLAFAGGTRYINQQSGCVQCHKRAPAKQLAQSAHKEVSCIECHGEQGITGALRQWVTYGRWVSVYATSKQSPKVKGRGVDDRACLRCHPAVPKETVVKDGIRVRHSDFLRTGIRCKQCHNSVAHPELVLEPSKPSMSECLPCHDGKKASLACETCHVKDAVLRTIAQDEGFGSVKMTAAQQRASCYRCHDEKPCITCHGVRMPHPEGWSSPQKHARPAFKNKEACWRCHFDEEPFVPSAKECQPCHRPYRAFEVHGGKGWVAEHGPQATGQKAGVLSDCFTCHTSNLCGLCHPPSYVDRYNPKSGPDTYQREVPLDPDVID
ncbi:MAG: hypothetical protein C4521_03935 [Actinobacteria bacterium]|nr:MAG: hypothetical protein C4521_03935 [Actinomycetota bacterium]